MEGWSNARGTMRDISNVNIPRHLISQISQMSEMTTNQTESRPTIFNQRWMSPLRPVSSQWQREIWRTLSAGQAATITAPNSAGVWALLLASFSIIFNLVLLVLAGAGWLGRQWAVTLHLRLPSMKNIWMFAELCRVNMDLFVLVVCCTRGASHI